MNINEISTGKKAFPKAYVFQKFPLNIFHASGEQKFVQSEDELSAALAQGWAETPFPVTAVAAPAVANKGADAGAGNALLQAKIDGLTLDKKNLSENFDKLLGEYRELQKRYEDQGAATLELQGSWATLLEENDALKKAAAEANSDTADDSK